VLDAGFAERIRPWPQILLALMQRAARRACDLDVQRAIAAQPRLEVRLALLLWHLGARWGKVEPGGIRIPLPLTHRLLGQLVGAERPSVSHALARLADAGLVTGRADEWHLHGTVEQHLAALADRDSHHTARAFAHGVPALRAARHH
jgi:CRP/FNR family transcriptional regulator, cyclic AMP receptor protein